MDRQGQNSGIQVALKGNPAPDPFACFFQGYGPVNTQRVASGFRQGFQLGITCFTKKDYGYWPAFILTCQTGDDSIQIPQGKFSESRGRERSAPGIENLDDLSPAFNLGIEVIRDCVSQFFQQLVGQSRVPDR